MRNTWLIIQREYMERVRTKSFVVLTLLAPALMTVLLLLPVKLATMGDKVQHIVVVTSTPQFGELVRQRLLALSAATDDDDESNPEPKTAKQPPEKPYIIDVDPNSTEAERAVLRGEIASKAIDGYLWLSDDAIANGKITWASRSMGSFGERRHLTDELSR